MIARKRFTLSQLRHALYLTQRDIGDVQAVERGPGSYAKRRGPASSDAGSVPAVQVRR